MSAFPWLKGHGTENDFVLLPDPDGTIHGGLDVEAVRFLCDRRRGIGADGVLRVVRSAALPAGRPVAAGAEWFMDYRNADGSLAQMCGNGIRVFVRYLLAEGLVDGAEPVAVGTRGGVRTVRTGRAGHAGPGGDLTVDMGAAEVPEPREALSVSVGGRSWPATALFIPNPHAVVLVDDLADAGALLTAPDVSPASAFPEGVNVEFVRDVAAAHVALRVHERGVGETRSCGTGACAAAVVAMRRDGAPAGTPYTVDVPGGRLRVVQRGDGAVELTGPAVVGVRGEFQRRWLDEPGW